MPRCTVFRSRHGDQLLVDCQADRLAHLKTRFVVPLVPAAMIAERIGTLHPEFSIDGQTMVLATHLASTISVSEIGRVVATLADDDHRIVDALDVLIGTA